MEVRMGRPLAYTPEEESKAKSLHAQGLSIRKIAALLNLKRSTVHRMIRDVDGATG